VFFKKTLASNKTLASHKTLAFFFAKKNASKNTKKKNAIKKSKEKNEIFFSFFENKLQKERKIEFKKK
jgi:hypothetical protein